jgi:hypothetical protein
MKLRDLSGLLVKNWMEHVGQFEQLGHEFHGNIRKQQ